MSTKQNIEVHESENWAITLTAHDAAGAVLPLVSGTDVQFRINDSEGEVLTKSIGDGVTVTNETNGTAVISVTAAEQLEYGLTAEKMFFYEIQVIQNNNPSVQAEGRLLISSSLFGLPSGGETPLVFAFHTRFPEFTEDDQLIALYIEDAARVVDNNDSWSVADAPIAKVYLAAHLLAMRKKGQTDYTNLSSGGGSTGAVKMIRVEDRAVSFDTGASAVAAMSQRGLAQTVYGQHYLSMLRRNVVFIKRA